MRTSQLLNTHNTPPLFHSTNSTRRGLTRKCVIFMLGWAEKNEVMRVWALLLLLFRFFAVLLDFMFLFRGGGVEWTHHL